MERYYPVCMWCVEYRITHICCAATHCTVCHMVNVSNWLGRCILDLMALYHLVMGIECDVVKKNKKKKTSQLYMYMYVHLLFPRWSLLTTIPFFQSLVLLLILHYQYSFLSILCTWTM